MDRSYLQDHSSTVLHRIIFDPMGISCLASDGQTIMEIAASRNILIRSDCGGQGRCGQCLVAVYPEENLSPVSENERQQLTLSQIQNGFRLACEANVRGSVRVWVSDSVRRGREVIGKSEMKGIFSSDPMVRRIVVNKKTVSQSKTFPRDLVELIKGKMGVTSESNIRFVDLDVLRNLSQLWYVGDDMTLVNHVHMGVTAVLSGRKTRSLGVALDIGTTTLAVYLCDLETSAVIASAAAANPQRSFGEDVISRIAFTCEKDFGLPLLRKALIDEVNKLIAVCIDDTATDLSDIDEMTVVGNTTMEQIFMGIHPHGLGFSPYMPVSCFPKDLRAADLSLNLNPSTNVHIFPVISGFVGGDTVGVLLSEKPYEKNETTLIVDIGTNGEVIVGNRKGLWVTSCATGPALEGAHIHCGMRASVGAIYRVAISQENYEVRYKVIGNNGNIPPRGICGSGIIDTVAEMRKTGLIFPSGQIHEGMPGVITDCKGIGRKFMIASSDKMKIDRDIVITLEDIRQVQLAKSALFVGIKLLMRRAGIDHFDCLVLTGAFGASFDWKNAVAIGMLPSIPPQTKIKIVPNAAGRGAVTALLDGKHRRQICQIAKEVQVLELAKDPDFAIEFTNATLFPESRQPFFEADGNRTAAY